MIRVLFFSLLLSCFGLMLSAQITKSVEFYQQLARQNHPVLKQNKNVQQIVLLQNDLLRRANNKPQVSLTGDLMFTPALFRNGKVISLATIYEDEGLGYDLFLSNRTLYAGQFNIAQNVLNRKIIRSGISQNMTYNRSVDLANQQLIHDIDKSVSDQYIAVYQTQQQMAYARNIMQKLSDRKNLVEQLVKKGVMAESDFLLLGISLKEEENGYEQLRIQLINGFGQLHMLCNVQDTTMYEFEKPDLSLTLPSKEYQFQQKYETDSLYAVWQQKVSETKYLPQLSLFGNAGIYSSSLSTIYRNIGFSGGVHLQVPIYDGQQRKNVARQFGFEKENLKIGRDYAERQLMTNVYYLKEQIRATEKSIGLIDGQIKAHEQLLNILKEKILLGQTSVMDYLVSLQDYATTCRNKAVTETNLSLLINQYNYINW